MEKVQERSIKLAVQLNAVISITGVSCTKVPLTWKAMIIEIVLKTSLRNGNHRDIPFDIRYKHSPPLLM